MKPSLPKRERERELRGESGERNPTPGAARAGGRAAGGAFLNTRRQKI